MDGLVLGIVTGFVNLVLFGAAYLVRSFATFVWLDCLECNGGLAALVVNPGFLLDSSRAAIWRVTEPTVAIVSRKKEGCRVKGVAASDEVMISFPARVRLWNWNLRRWFNS